MATSVTLTRSSQRSLAWVSRRHRRSRLLATERDQLTRTATLLASTVEYRNCFARLSDLATLVAIASDVEDACHLAEAAPSIPQGFQIWLEEQSSAAIAWVGEKGAGKSLLARTLYRKLRTLPGASVAYFSFTETDARQSTVTAFLASVILQILSQDRHRFPRVQDLLHALKERYAWTETGLYSLFHSLMDTRHGLRPVHLVVDGIHRCTDRPSCEKLLETLFSVVGNGEALTPLKIALFYEDHRYIQDLVAKFTGPWCQPPKLDQGGFSAPIHTLVRQEVAKLVAEKQYLFQMKKPLSDTLTRCKNPVEVALAIEAISRPLETGVPLTRMALKQMISHLPFMSASNAAGARLKLLPNWARTALGWIYCAKRPLRLGELSLALALTDDKGDFVASLDAQRLPVNLSERLVTELGPFLGVQSGVVVFRNDNVRRFFSDAMKEEEKSGHPIVSESSASRDMGTTDRKGIIPTHSHITKILLRYISSSEFIKLFKKTSERAKDSGEPGILALAEYAVRFLPDHYRMGKNKLSAQDHFRNISDVAEMWPRLTATFNPTASPPDITVLNVYFVAAQLGFTSVIEHLEASGKVGDLSDSDRAVAVTVATWGCHQDTLNDLLNRIPKTPESGARLIPALQHALWRGHRLIAKTLLDWVGESQFDASTDLEKLICQMAELGYEKDIDMLLKIGQVGIHAAPDGQTPLQHAARNGNAALVKILLDTWRADVDAKVGIGHLTPIQLAAERGHERVIQHLLAKNATTSELDQKPRSDHTPLYLAAANGHEEAVGLLLDKVTKKELASYKESPLIVACAKGHRGIASRLTKAGVKLHQLDNQQHSALYYAVQSKNETLALDIATAATDTLEAFKDIGEIFLLAAESGLVKVVCKCINVRSSFGGDREKFPITEYTDDEGCTALHQASKHGHNEVVSLLLESGADQNCQNKEMVTPIVIAAVAGEAEVVNTLRKKGAKVEGRVGPDLEHTPLTFVVERGKDTKRHADALYELVKATENPNEPDYFERTPLHSAVMEGALHRVKALLRAPNVNPTATGAYDWNALHYLAQTNTSATMLIAEILINARVSVRAPDIDKWLPLHIAAKMGNIPLVKRLWRQNKNTLSAKTSNGRTVLHFAVGEPAQLKWLLKRRNYSKPPLNIDDVDNNGYTALFNAVLWGDEESARVLLDGGADPTACSRSPGYMVLHDVADRGDLAMGRLLLGRHEHLLSAKTKSLITALHHAILEKKPEFAEMLLDEFYTQASDDVRKDLSLAVLESQDTPLISAVKLRQKNVVRKLLDLGAETEGKNREGQTALLCAVKMARGNDIEMLESLFEGAEASDRPPNATLPNIDAGGDRLHPTALSIVAQAGELGAVKALVRFRARIDAEGGLYGTAVCAAVASSEVEVANFLLNNGASPKSDGFVFANALGLAIWSYASSLISSILSSRAGIDIDDTDYQGRSALHLAVNRGDRTTFSKLYELSSLKYDKQVGPDKQGRYLLHHAATSGDFDMFTTIYDVEKHVLDKPDKDGWTPLHWACRQDSNYEIVNYIVGKSPESITHSTPDEWTPLNIAVFHRATNIANYIQSQLHSLSSSDGQPADSIAMWGTGEEQWARGCDGCFIFVSLHLYLTPLSLVHYYGALLRVVVAN